MAIQTTSDKTFKADVLDQKDKYVLVDFWAEWCGPCKMLAPVVAKVAEKHADKLVAFKLDVDSNPESAQKYQISSIPCCIVYKNGEEKGRLMGFKPEPAFDKDLQNLLT